jgi:membrane-bound lytic murein transglycosylase D
MAPAERTVFVNEQAQRIGWEMSGRDYRFTPGFVAVIQRNLDSYIKRIAHDGVSSSGSDLRLTLQRGQNYAPEVGGAFKSKNLSPIIGIYLPMIESEFVNLSSPNSMGAVGMFQFLPQTGERFGLSTEDLLDVAKSADAAARFIQANLRLFNDDPMKEALALLSYNRGANKVVQDVDLVVTEDKRSCSICALTDSAVSLDRTFKDENVHYVPRFFAAAIIGENPTVFGLTTPPLSSLVD